MSRIPARRSAFLGVLAVLAGLTCRDTLTNPTEIPRPPSPGGPVFSALPTGITETMVAQGLAHPTAMAVAPDGRIFIAEQAGRLRVYKDGALLTVPFLTVTVNSTGERGLLGVAFDPGFASNNYVYVYYTTATAPLHNRVSRFTAAGDVAQGSEVVIFDLDALSSANNHNGGALHFGPDGKLYIAVGDNATSANAQSMTSMFGKILRINADGTIPEDNPFFASATGNYRAIWAMGLRNPFTFAFQPGSGRMFINDVGENTWEEVDEGIAGANYGWPSCEGTCSPSNPNFRDPVTAYSHTAGECAVAGATFYNPPSGQLLPSSYIGKYFFADYCAGWIRVLDPATGSATGFATSISYPVDLQVGNDGALYYLGNYRGELFRVTGTSTQAPLISQQPSNALVATGQSATFTTAATGSPTLTYQWRRGGADIPGATSPSYTIGTTALSDNGATFDCVITNPYGTATTNVVTLTVAINDPPVGIIESPTAGTTYHGGQTFDYSGSGTDPETGALPDSAFTWEIVFHHDTHTHPFMLPTTGSKNGSFVIPTQGEVSSNVYYAIKLTVRDPRGATTTVERDIVPETATISIASTPSGAQLTLDGQPITPPHSVVGVVGIQRSIGIAASPQTIAGSSYTFTSWSDGGAATHTIATPASNTTYTASFDATPCTYAVSSQSRTVVAAGGAYSVDVTAGTGCSWVAVSNDPWITITDGASGQGNAPTSYSVQANAGVQRVGTMTIAGKTFTVTQSNGCAYTLSPTSQSLSAAAGAGSFGVTTDPSCAWTATTPTSWITVTSASGTGNGTANYSVTGNAGAPRNGSITVGGQTFSVSQSAGNGCVYTISPSSKTYTTAAGTGAINVTAPSNTCLWTSVSNNTWIKIGQWSDKGGGNGTSEYSVTANTGPQRTGTITIAGFTHSVTQAGTVCAYSISPTSRTHTSASGTASITVTTGTGCTWSASSNTPWITLTPGTETGNGNGAASYSVAANTGAQRSGSITIAGQTFGVTQNAGCTYSISPATQTLPETAGGGSVGVTTNPSCVWTATSNNAWITITAGTESGTGSGTTSFSVSDNPGVQRTGSVTVGGQVMSVTQNGGTICSFTLNATGQTHSPSSGGGSIAVSGPSGCPWTATSNAAWITLTPGTESGNGDGTSSYAVAANTGAQRNASITIAGQTYSVTQGSGCSYVVSPAGQTVAAGSGGGSIGVTAGTGCTWSASSNTAWITVTPGTESGSGNGTANYSVAANTGPARNGSITIAGQTFGVTQNNGCAYAISPTAQSLPATDGGSSVAVTTDPACSWTATSNNGWITITPGSESGTGDGTTSFSVAANAGPPRTGSIAIGGKTFSLTQDGIPCNYAINPTGQTHPSGGGSGSISVTTASACPWTASSNNGWITVSAGNESGTGDGAVNYSVVANTGVQRTGSITVGGQTYSVTQDNGCSYTINPPSRNHGAVAGSGSVGVATGTGCTWSASSNSAWITVSPGSESGVGGGTSNYSVEANTGPSRNGSITVAGQTFAVTQSSGCTYSINPTAQTMAATSGTGTVDVMTDPACAWSATSNSGWIAVTPGSESGTGSGTTSYSVPDNTGAQRSGSITVAGQTFTVTQTSTCMYTLTPTSRSHSSTSGSGSIAVTAGNGCSWTASSNNTWITVTAGASGAGNGTTNYSVTANTGIPRNGSITIGGQAFSVAQSGCTYTITPTSGSHASTASTGAINVTTGSGCAWTSVSNDSWIKIGLFSDKGAGNGTSEYSVTANTGPQRTGSITIAGQTYTVTQNVAGCSYTITPTSRTHTPTSGSGSISMTAGTGCPWTATSNNSWITVTSGSSGSGNGTTNYSVTANTGAQRTGTLSVGGQTFTVTQTGCSYTITPTSRTHTSSGGTGTVTVTAGTGCSWTAQSNNSWITVTGGSSGTGNGTVSYSVSARSGPARTGTITIAGRMFTVNQ